MYSVNGGIMGRSLNRPYLKLIFLLVILLVCIAEDTRAKVYKGAELYIQSQHQVLYGRIEVRMLAAKGSGILSTFFTWKDNSEKPGVIWEEIDVEIFGKTNAVFWQSNILSGDPRRGSEQVHYSRSLLADKYHTYTVEWAPDYVAWFFDSLQVRKTSGGQANELVTKAGIRFNLWASSDANWAGAWNDNVLPQYQFVNWIKYYRFDQGNFILDWQDDFDTLDGDRWGKADWTFDGNRADFDPANILVQDGTLILCLTKEGETGFTGTVPVDEATAIPDAEISGLPQKFTLEQNFPNPFNPQTTINFAVDEPGQVNIVIYDVLGREIKVLLDGEKRAGFYSIDWNGRDYRNMPVPSGIYIYQLKAGSIIQSKKMILLQ